VRYDVLPESVCAVAAVTCAHAIMCIVDVKVASDSSVLTERNCNV
jgi:hypothetical protein